MTDTIALQEIANAADRLFRAWYHLRRTPDGAALLNAAIDESAPPLIRLGLEGERWYVRRPDGSENVFLTETLHDMAFTARADAACAPFLLRGDGGAA